MGFMVLMNPLSRRQFAPWLGGLALSLLPHKDAMTQAQSLASSSTDVKTQLLKGIITGRDGALSLDFELVREGDQRLVFSSLRSTAALKAISLVDPLQRRLWRKTPAELGLTPGAAAIHSELGDAMVLPEIRNPEPGRWQLVLETAPGAQGQVLLSYRLLPRYELSMSVVTVGGDSRVAAGQPLQLQLRAQDYGVPLVGLAAVPLSLLNNRGEVLEMWQAKSGVRTPAGILLSQEPGLLTARIRLPSAGEYRLLARQAFGATHSPLQVELALTATAAKGALALSGLRIEPPVGPARDCASAVVFDFDVRVTLAGGYACNISLVGPKGTRMASASAALSAGQGRISVRVEAETLAALGAPLTRLARVGLIFLGPTAPGVVAELEALDLNAAQKKTLQTVCTG